MDISRRSELRPGLAGLVLSDYKRDEILAMAANEISAALGTDRVALWTYSAEFGTVAAEYPAGRSGRLELTADEADALFAGHAETNPGIGIGARLAQANFSWDGDNQATTVIPLCVGGVRVGVAIVERHLSDPDDPGEIRLSELVTLVAATLVNFDTLARREQHEARLEVLLSTVAEMSSNLQLEDVLKSITTRARGLMRAPMGYIMLVDEERTEIYMRAATGIDNEGFSRLRLGVGVGLGGMALAQGKPVYTNDYLNDDRIAHKMDVDNEVRLAGIKSIMGVPMLRRGEIIGVLYVADRLVRTFSSSDVEVLMSLAQQAALAIENARLYERDTAALDELRRTNALVRSQNERLRRVDNAQQEFTEAMLSGRGLNGIATCAAGLMNTPIVILDDHERVLAQAGVSKDVFGLRLAAEGIGAELRQRPDIKRVLSDVATGTSSTLAPIEGIQHHPRLVAPVVAGQEIFGSIWVEAAEGTFEAHRAIIDQAARVVALEILKERSITEVERRLRRELLDDLLVENPSPVEVIKRKASNLGVSLDGPLRLLVVRMPAAEANKFAARRHYDVFISGVRDKRWCVFAADHLGYVVALLSDWDDEIRAVLAGELQDAGARAVVSSACTSLAEYGRSFIGARNILELIADHAGLAIIDLEEARVLGLLFDSGDAGKLHRFVDACLAPVWREDRDGRLDLVDTLETYLASGASPTRTAKALHLHVNSVYYRLKFLKRALGEDFAVPHRALDLQVACLGRRLLDIGDDPGRNVSGPLRRKRVGSTDASKLVASG